MTSSSLISFMFIATVLGSATALFGVTNVQDPSGKTVLVVDGDNIKKNAAGAAILKIDGDKIVDASGKTVLFCAGDMIRDKPEGNLMLMIDGRHIKRGPGGDNLLYVDGRNLMRGDRAGKPLYKFAGDEIGSKERMAVLYVLMPEIFGASKAADAAMIQAQATGAVASDAASTKDFPPGEYTVDIYRSTGTTPDRRGNISVAKVGDVLVFEFKYKQGDAEQGVAIQKGDELWVAAGPAGAVGLAAYDVKGGNLTGTWYNATGKPESFGSESLSGADPLGGAYKITEAKAPGTHAPYTGTLTLDAIGKHFDKNVPIFDAAWDLGGYKAKGVGFGEAGGLALATSNAPDFTIYRFKIDLKNNQLVGQFYTAAKVGGIINLKKAK